MKYVKAHHNWKGILSREHNTRFFDIALRSNQVYNVSANIWRAHNFALQYFDHLKLPTSESFLISQTAAICSLTVYKRHTRYIINDSVWNLVVETTQWSVLYSYVSVALNYVVRKKKQILSIDKQIECRYNVFYKCDFNKVQMR